VQGQGFFHGRKGGWTECRERLAELLAKLKTKEKS
jgi:hypothetical protein